VVVDVSDDDRQISRQHIHSYLLAAGLHANHRSRPPDRQTGGGGDLERAGGYY